jgi:hypothetical protein
MKRIRRIGVLLFVITLLALAFAPRSDAATPAINIIPKLCAVSPPVPQSPSAGLAGIFEQMPKNPPNVSGPADPNHLFETSGLAGMEPFTYDLGCGLDPGSYGTQLNAWSDQQLSSRLVMLGQAATVAADATSRFAFDPSWVVKLLSSLTSQAVGVIQVRILLPFLGLGLIATSMMLMKRARRGNTQGVMDAISWMLITLVVAAAVIVLPTTTATTTQTGVGLLTSTLYDGASPAQAATDRAAAAIHYDGWLRRTFGTSDSAVAQQYGPKILADTRMTWYEEESTDPALVRGTADKTARVKARAALIATKEADFKVQAKAVKAADPEAYLWLTDREAASSSVAIYESAFAVTVAGFRIAVNMLMILCIILLGFLPLLWLIALPRLVTPEGERLGKKLLDTTARAIGTVVVTAVGVWLYTIYTEAAMQAGWPTWVSALLMLIGVFIFWTALRPDRHMLSLLTTGRVRGNGRFVRRAMQMTSVGRIAAQGWMMHQARQTAKELSQTEEEAEARDERDAAAHAELTRLVGQPDRPVPAMATSDSAPAPYQRPDSGEFMPDPVPPPRDTQTEIYQRPYDEVVEHYNKRWDQAVAEEKRRKAAQRERTERND